METAAQTWARALAEWAIPPEILDQAPRRPYVFDPTMFAPPPVGTPLSAASRRAAAALPVGGSVLDVGCGGGAAAFALVPPAGLIVGTDQQADMVDVFLATAAERGVEAEGFAGPWPEMASEVPAVDVVVCHNVLYNVADLEPFVRALDGRARRRVVIEITPGHPQSPRAPLWKHFWDLDRPTEPSATTAAEAIAEFGFDVTMETGPATERDRGGNQAAMMCRQLCLPPEREPEVAEMMARVAFPAERVTLWWDVTG